MRSVSVLLNRLEKPPTDSARFLLNRIDLATELLN